MQTEREYLVGLGLAKEGRGKFSNAGKEALAKARADGVTFKTTGPNPTVRSRPTVVSGGNDKATETPAAPVADRQFPPYLTQDDYRFPEDQYKAVGLDGKVWGMRECCNTCRVSLVGHFCDSPTILNGIVVHIRPKVVVNG